MTPTTDAGPKPRVALAIATGLGLGYLPKAPGTWGSLLGVVLGWGALAGTTLPLQRVRLHEREDFFAEVWDDESMFLGMRMPFSAAHRLHVPTFSNEQNIELFGKCNNPNWHGHNYTLDVSVEGEIDPKTGYVCDLSQLKKIVEREIVDIVDHKNFNLDVPFMNGIIPTSENIILAFWGILNPKVKPGKLARLVLWETENNYVEYTGK